MNKGIVWLVAIAVVIGAVVWWGASREEGTSTTGPYKIGVILPLTGDAAVYGEPGRNILELAAREINASVSEGQSVQLIFEDGKCNGQDAANATQKLVNVDGIQVIIGGFCSSESLAAVPIAEQAKVAMISPGSSSPKLTAISDYFVRNYPSDSTQGSVLANIAYTDKGWRTVAFLQEQTDYALGIYNAFSDEFTKLGGSTTNESFPTETTDFRSVVSKVKGQDPDAVFVDTQTPAVAARIFTQMQQLGWKPPLLVSDVTPGDPATVSAHKTFLEGTLAAEFGVDTANPKFAALLIAYQSAYGAAMSYQGYGQTEYDSLYLVYDAIKAVGYDGAKIAQWLRTNVKEWQGAAGSVTIGANGDPVTGHRAEVITRGAVQPYTE